MENTSERGDSITKQASKELCYTKEFSLAEVGSKKLDQGYLEQNNLTTRTHFQLIPFILVIPFILEYQTFMTEDKPEKKSKNTVQRSTRGKTNRKNKKAGKHQHPRKRKAGSPKDSTPDSLSTPPLDEETVAALTLFNTYMEADRERAQHKQKIRKAENLKKNIATKIRKLRENKGSTEELEKAKSAYREAVEDLNRLQEAYKSDSKRREASESKSKTSEDSLKSTETAKTAAETKSTETAKTSEGEDAQSEASESTDKDSSVPQQNA